MAFQVIVRNRATQDIRQQANYILVNGNRESGEKFLEFVEYTFTQLAITPNMGKVVLSLSDMGTIRQWRLKNFGSSVYNMLNYFTKPQNPYMARILSEFIG